MTTALDRFDSLDVVVNNAGITRDRMLVNLAEDDWDDVLRVHVKSTFLLTQRAAQRWRSLSKDGVAVAKAGSSIERSIPARSSPAT